MTKVYEDIYALDNTLPKSLEEDYEDLNDLQAAKAELLKAAVADLSAKFCSSKGCWVFDIPVDEDYSNVVWRVSASEERLIAWASRTPDHRCRNDIDRALYSIFGIPTHKPKPGLIKTYPLSGDFLWGDENG